MTTGRRTALISCLEYGGERILRIRTPYLSKCGVLHRLLLSLVLPQPSTRQTKSAPHFSFCIISSEGREEQSFSVMGFFRELLSEDDSPKQREVKIKGVVQRNGVITANRTFIVDDIN